MEVSDLRLELGDCAQFIGPPRSGKTFYIYHLLREKNRFIQSGEQVQNVCFWYRKWQPIYSRMKSEGLVNQWFQGFPTAEDFDNIVSPYRFTGGSICIMDDCLDIYDSGDLRDIVSTLARHNQACVFLLMQSLFSDNVRARQTSRNIKQIFLFQCPRDKMQFSYLAREMYPGNTKWLIDAYAHVTRKQYRCLIMDFRPECPEYCRIRSNALSHERPMKSYVPVEMSIPAVNK